MAKRSRQRPGSGEPRQPRPTGPGSSRPTGAGSSRPTGAGISRPTGAGISRPSGAEPTAGRPAGGDGGRVRTGAATTTTRRSRPVRRTQERGFLDRYRTVLTLGAAVVGVLIIGFLFFGSSARGAFSCDMLLTPGPTEPPITPRPSAVATPTAGGSPSAAPTSAASATAGASPSPAATATGSAAPSPGLSPAASASAAASASPVASAAPTASAGASASPDASPSAAPSAAQSAAPSVSPGASPSPPPPDPTPRLGFTTVDLGRTHVRDPAQTLRYDFCPPTSGDHYQVGPLAPIPAELYPPAEEQSPGSWVHNLEHGYIVVLYRCPTEADCVSEEELAELQRLVDEAPSSPVAQACPRKVLVARFDEMTTRFAVLAWGRALLTDNFDVDTAKTFAQQWMDHEAAPERGAC